MLRMDNQPAIFGSRRRSEILLLLGFLQSSYPSELARLLRVRPFSVQGILNSLEKEGVVTSRLVGRTRVFQLDPRRGYAKELRALLDKLGEGETQLRARAASLRRRPRRPGKKL
jgi:DNA-binding transcriptional ArsR family regulator